MRDLSEENWNDLFCGALDWRRDYVTGTHADSVSQIGNSFDILPYKGQASLSFTSQDKSQFSRIEETAQASRIENIGYNQMQSQSTYSYTDAYCTPFNHYSPDGPVNMGLSLSVLKKDGSWDCIYTTNPYMQINVSIEKFALHYSEEEYARGTTGGLRYRLTECIEHIDNTGSKYHTYRVKYFTRDFTPQKATIRYSGEHSEPQKLTSSSFLSDDDYFVDVKVGIANIEGATKVIVEQLDEGERLPFQYEAENFREGYFIANLDRELSTKLTIICYNDNGYKRSNTITINPVGYPAKTITFHREGNEISFDGVEKVINASGNLSYTIQNMASTAAQTIQEYATAKTINISNLPNGIYVLSIYNGSDKIGYYKFVK